MSIRAPMSVAANWPSVKPSIRGRRRQLVTLLPQIQDRHQAPPRQRSREQRLRRSNFAFASRAQGFRAADSMSQCGRAASPPGALASETLLDIAGSRPLGSTWPFDRSPFARRPLVHRRFFHEKSVRRAIKCQYCLAAASRTAALAPQYPSRA